MLIYGKNLDSKGEKNYIDTDYLDQIIMNASNLDAVKDNKSYTLSVNYRLSYEKSSVMINGILIYNGNEITRNIELDYERLIDEAYEAFTKRLIIDSTDIIKESKSKLESLLTSELINDGFLVVGCGVDAIGLVKVNGVTVSVLDDILIEKLTDKSLTIIAGTETSLSDIANIDTEILKNNSKFEIHLKNSNVIKCDIRETSIMAEDDKRSISLYITEDDSSKAIEFESYASFKDKEELVEARAKLLDSDFEENDDFDDDEFF